MSLARRLESKGRSSAALSTLRRTLDGLPSAVDTAERFTAEAMLREMS
jgi:hypothetical protein